MFTQPIAMRCTQRQFLNIQKELQDLGYTFSSMRDNWESYVYLVNNAYSTLGDVANALTPNINGRIVFETWNKDLFLALAAMTDDKFRIGQLVKWNNDGYIDTIKKHCPHHSDSRYLSKDYNSCSERGLVRLTAQKIIDHFTKTQTSTTMSTENFKITVEQFKQLHSIACSDWKNKLQTWVKGTDLFTTHVTLTSEQVSEIFKAATSTQLPVVKEVFLEFGRDVKNYKDVAEALLMSKSAYRLSSSGGVDVVSCVNCPDWLNLSTSKEQLESLLAINQLANVAKYLNGDWKASFKNSMGKHFLYIEGSVIRVTGCYDANKGCIYFKTEELAKKAIKILGEGTIRKALSIGCH